MHAQKDMSTTVKDNQTNMVEKGNRILTVALGNEVKNISKGSLVEDVKLLRSTTANFVQVKAEGDSPGTQLYTATQQIELEVGAGNIIMTTESITLSFGASSVIQLNKDGILIKGTVVDINPE